MSKKLKVTLIQSNDGQVRRVRLGDSEVEVQSAMPTLIGGKVSVSLMLQDVEIDGVMEADLEASETRKTKR